VDKYLAMQPPKSVARDTHTIFRQKGDMSARATIRGEHQTVRFNFANFFKIEPNLLDLGTEPNLSSVWFFNFFIRPIYFHHCIY